MTSRVFSSPLGRKIWTVLKPAGFFPTRMVEKRVNCGSCFSTRRDEKTRRIEENVFAHFKGNSKQSNRT